MKIESYQIRDWEDNEVGVLLDENDDWILIQSIPGDYQVDGYKLLRKNFVEERYEVENAHIIKKVIELKGIEIQKPDDFKFGSTIEILKWSESKYGCFEFQDDIEEELTYGALVSFDLEIITIDFIKSDGTIDIEFDEIYTIEDIRTISFDSDYFRSISLLYNYYKKNKE